MVKKKSEKMAQRVAVVDRELCKPKKCGLVCQKSCPIVRSGEDCIVYEVAESERDEGVNLKEKDAKKKIIINEQLCVGCGICVKKCPYKALNVVNLPKELNETSVHRFGPNEFVLYRLPFPSSNKIVGIVGPNGVGKTTALRILSGEIKPNLGDFETESNLENIVDIFRGTEMQAYMEQLENNEIRTSIKPQRVDKLSTVFKGNISKLLDSADERKIANDLVSDFGLDGVMDREVAKLSGGELQRVAIIAAIAKDADIYYFDEPTSFLDVFQRLNAAKLIRKYCEGKSVMIVDHDLAALDFLADRIHIFYGVPAVYGIVSKPRGVRVGINTFLDGYIKEDNVRFRKDAISFLGIGIADKIVSPEVIVSFADVKKKFGKSFALNVGNGEIHEKEVLAVLGANAIGKTTFAKILAGELKADSGMLSESVQISYKPQYIKTDFIGTVRELLETVAAVTNAYKSEIIHPLSLEKLLEKDVEDLSGGELQRVAIAICLSRDAELYLLDEPSAFLDVEQRLAVAKLVNKITEVHEKSALVVDHDLLFLSQTGHRGMVFLGQSGVSGEAEKIDDMKDALNKFLEKVGVTFRQDPQTGRPRANKIGSQLDREQKEAGEYFTI